MGGIVLDVGTVLAFAIACIAPAAVLGLVFVMPKWMAAAGEARRRRLRRRGALMEPVGPPLERLAADLRRLRQQQLDPQRSRVQREGARLAYGDVLRATAERLGVPHQLDRMRPGLGRELELLRVEQALLAAGLVLGTP